MVTQAQPQLDKAATRFLRKVRRSMKYAPLPPALTRFGQSRREKRRLRREIHGEFVRWMELVVRNPSFHIVYGWALTSQVKDFIELYHPYLQEFISGSDIISGYELSQNFDDLPSTDANGQPLDLWLAQATTLRCYFLTFSEPAPTRFWWDVHREDVAAGYMLLNKKE